MPTVNAAPTPDSPFVAIRSAAKMPSTCWGRYEHVAVIETDGVTTPKMLSTRARGVKRIVWSEPKAHVGGPQAAAARAWERALRLALHHNRLHQHKIDIKPIRAMDIDTESNEHFRRDMIEAFGGVLAYINAPGSVVVNRDKAGVLVFRNATDGFNPADGRTFPYCAVIVTCPSTGARYALRVPPWCMSARHAVAWTFGLEPSEYNPMVQT